jgi:hypothetical protein
MTRVKEMWHGLLSGNNYGHVYILGIKEENSSVIPSDEIMKGYQ